MNFFKKFGILFFLLIGCKKEIQSNKKQEPIAKQEMVVQKKIVSKNQDSIRVFHASFLDNNVQNKTEKISILTKKIQSHFIEYPFESTSNELEESKEGYREKSFLKTLAQDFKNKDFLDISSIYYSYVVPNNNIKSGYITIEEWYFKDEQKAKSCFESLQKYEEFTIHFKSINWIWIYQAHKIFLVFALDHVVTGKKMQQIKKEIINIIKPSGAYESVQFYE